MGSSCTCRGGRRMEDDPDFIFFHFFVSLENFGTS